MKSRSYSAPFGEVVDSIIRCIEGIGMLLVADIDVQIIYEGKFLPHDWKEQPAENRVSTLCELLTSGRTPC